MSSERDTNVNIFGIEDVLHGMPEIIGNGWMGVLIQITAILGFCFQ
jgi:hypothetical protein